MMLGRGRRSCGPERKVPVGETLHFSDTLRAEVLERGEHGERTIRFAGDVDVLEEADHIGHVPLPPYIRREDRTDDRSRYQTVYAQSRGSVAAPTAGLHFTPEVLDRCRAAGADVARVTLHVGLGTFAPLHVETLDEVRLHYERYSVEPADLAMIRGATGVSPSAQQASGRSNRCMPADRARAKRTSSSAPAIISKQWTRW